MDMNQLLESIYASSDTDTSLEKTAESNFLNGITPEAPAQENPFDSMSLEELVKLAQDLEGEEAPEVAEAAEPEATVTHEEEAELNKTAAAMFGGQLMAHAVVHELGLIKVAVANGICRVCKTNEMDVEASSICSDCHGDS